MNTLYISIDESGTFASSDEYFVFGGYAILGTERYHGKIRKYSKIEQQVTATREVKGNELDMSDKLQLIKVMENVNSFAVSIKNKSLGANCYTDNLTKALVKDDILKNIILDVIGNYELAQIDKIVIEIDEQNLKFGIRQNLFTALYRVLISGYYSRNQFIKGLAVNELILSVSFVDSKQNTWVRAADVLVNLVNQKLKSEQDVYSILKIFKPL